MAIYTSPEISIASVSLDFLFWDNVSFPGEMVLSDSVRQLYIRTGIFFSDFVPLDTVYDRTPTQVPEPATTMLLATGLLALAVARKRIRAQG